MPYKASAPDLPSAKTRIIEAAVLLFARTPFSETSLRDIATAAQVDVAYVHRAFGSKSEIFRQALQGIGSLEGMFKPPADPDTVIERICDRAFLRDPQNVKDVQPFHLIMQSCTCSEARSFLDDFIRTALVEPLAEVFGHKDLGHATFAISILSGFISMRLVIGNSVMHSMPDEVLKAMLRKALYGAMTR